MYIPPKMNRPQPMVTSVDDLLLGMPLVDSAGLKRGKGPATFTRAAKCLTTDTGGVLRTFYENEPAFTGARWESENLLRYSEDWTWAGWSKSAEATFEAPNKLTKNANGARVTQTISAIPVTTLTFSTQLAAGSTATAIQLLIYNNTKAGTVKSVTAIPVQSNLDAIYSITALPSDGVGISVGDQVTVYLYIDNTSAVGTYLVLGRAWLNSGTAILPYVKTVDSLRNSVSASGSTSQIAEMNGMRFEEQRTNKCMNYNVNPTDLTYITKSGDAAATLTVVDDMTALAAAGLDKICTSGKVYKLDNSGGSTAAYATTGGAGTNINQHSSSAYIRGGSGACGINQTGGRTAFVSAGVYRQITWTGIPDDTTKSFNIMANAGQVVYFILNQLEEGSPATSPIAVAGAAATRATNSGQLAIPSIQGNYNANEGVLYCEFTPKFNMGAKVNTHIAGVRNTIGDILYLGGSGTFTSSNGLNYPSSGYLYVSGETVKVCVRWNLGLQKYQVVAMGASNGELDFLQAFQAPTGIRVAQTSSFGSFDIKNILILDRDKGEAWCKAITSPNITQAWPFVTDSEILVKWSLNGTITPEKYNSAGGTVQYAHAITGYTTWLDKDNILRKAYTNEPVFCKSRWTSENLLKYSGDFSMAGAPNWVYYDGAALASSGELAPDGTNTAFKITSTNGSDAGYVFQLVTPDSTLKYYQIWFRGSGTVTFRTPVSGGSISVTLTDVWTRYEVSGVHTYDRFQFQNIGTSDTVYVWHPQIASIPNAPYVKTEAYPLNAGSNTYSNGALLSTCKGILIEPSRTNRCTNYNANPDAALTNVSKSGDAAAVLSRQLYTSQLDSAGLSKACASGYAIELNNSAGTTAAYIVIAGTLASLNPHTVSAYLLGIGKLALEGWGINQAFSSLGAFTKITGTGTPLATTNKLIIEVAAGNTVAMVLNQLEEGPTVTSPIVTVGAVATRASSTGAIGQGLALPLPGNFSDTITMVCEWTPEFSSSDVPNSTYGKGIVSVRNSGTSLLHFERDASGNTYLQTHNGTVGAKKTPLNFIKGTAYKVCVSASKALGMLGIAVNGSAGEEVATYDGSFIMDDYLRLIYNSINSQHIKNIKITSKYSDSAKRIALTS